MGWTCPPYCEPFKQCLTERDQLKAEVERLRALIEITEASLDAAKARAERIEKAARDLLEYSSLGAAMGWPYWEEKFDSLKQALAEEPAP